MKTEKQIKGKRNRLLKDLKKARTGWMDALKQNKETHFYTDLENKLEGEINALNWTLK